MGGRTAAWATILLRQLALKVLPIGSICKAIASAPLQKKII
jgi:hypothetical protein